MTDQEHQEIALNTCANRRLPLAIPPRITDNQGVQLARRGFLRLISALPAFAVFRSLPAQAAPTLDERNFQAIRAQMRALVDAHRMIQLPAHAGHTIWAGSEAINCYERGLFRHYRVVESTAVPANPSDWYFGRSTVAYSPHLGPWDISESPARA